MKINKSLLVIISLIVLILIVIFPNICINAASFSLTLWFQIVIPSLLPFFIGTAILSETGVIKLLGAFFEPVMRVFFRLPGESAFVLITSAISGYPTGAKISAELYEEKKMDLSAAQRTVCITSIGGPLFILGTVAYGLLQLGSAGFYILISHYLGAFMGGLLISLFFRKQKIAKTGYIAGIKNACRKFTGEKLTKSIGEILERAVMKSIGTMLLIGGMMVLFNVIISLLQTVGVMQGLSSLLLHLGIPAELSQPILTGIVEMTAGCTAAAQSAADMALKIPVLALIISFGGFSVHAQTYAITAHSGLKLRLFFTSKVIQAFASFVAAFVLLKLFPLTQAVFGMEPSGGLSAPSWLFMGSAFALLAMVMLFASSVMKKSRQEEH